MDQLYDNALDMMARAFDTLSRKVGNPKLQSMGDGYVYRFTEKKYSGI